jgi:hypothetical protein
MNWLKAHWKATLAVVLAFSIGAVAGAGGADQQQEIDRKDSRIASLRDDLSEAQTEIEQGEDALREAQSYRADALKYRRARTVIKREEAAALRAERKREQQQAETERQQREAEQQAAQGTIEGDGTWHVGEDFVAGTYRADAGGGCYWARLRTAHGSDSIDDIIDNGVGGGSQTVQLNDGEWFETAGCGSWQKIG